MATISKLLVELGLKDDNFGTGLDNAVGKTKNFGASMLKTGGMLTAGITLPMIAIGKVAWDAAVAYDGALDTIQTKTGATGDDLTALGDTARAVYRAIPTDIQTAADTVATLNQRTGATGQVLEDLTKTEIELARITGGDLASQVDTTTQMFEKWGISTADQVGSLDKLFRASQATGANIGTLSANMVKYAQPLSELGFGFEESIAILAQFEAAGVNVDQAMAGLKMGLVNMAKEGITDANEAFRTMVDRIKSAPNDMAATQIAIELFGAKAGPELAKAIRDGTMNVEDLMKVINGGGPGIMATAASTNDFAEKLQIIKNRATDALLPLGTQLFSAVNNLMPLFESATAKLSGLIEGFNGLPNPVQQVIGVVAGLLFVSGPLLMALGTLVTAAPAVGAAFTVMTGPIGLAVIAIVAAIALLFYAYQTNFLGFADGVNAAIDGVRAKFTEWLPTMIAVKDGFVSAWTAAEPVIRAVLELVKTHIAAMASAVQTTLEGLVNIVRGVMQVIKGIFTGDWELIKTGVGNIAQGLKQVVEGHLQALWASIVVTLGLIKLAFTTAWNGIKETVTSAVTGAANSVVSTLAGLKDRAFNAAWSAGRAIGDGMVSGINSMWDTVLGFAQSLINAALDLIGSIPGKIKDGIGGWIPGSIKRSSTSSVSAPGGMGWGSARSIVLNGGITINVNGSGDPRATADEVFSIFEREMRLAGA